MLSPKAQLHPLPSKSALCVSLSAAQSSGSLATSLSWVSPAARDSGLFLATKDNLYRAKMDTVHGPKLVQLPDEMTPVPVGHQRYKEFDVFGVPGKPVVLTRWSESGVEILAVSKEVAHIAPRIQIEEEALYFVTAENKLVRTVLGILSKPRELAKQIQAAGKPHVLSAGEVLAEGVHSFTSEHPHPTVVLLADGTAKSLGGDKPQVKLDLPEGAAWLGIKRIGHFLYAHHTRGLLLLGGDLVPRDAWHMPLGHDLLRVDIFANTLSTYIVAVDSQYNLRLGVVSGFSLRDRGVVLPGRLIAGAQFLGQNKLCLWDQNGGIELREFSI